MDPQEQTVIEFSTTFPLQVLVRPSGNPAAEWQEFDHGEGLYRIPGGNDVYVRVHNIDDQQLSQLVREISAVATLPFLNLSENRKITDDGLRALKALPNLTDLNLSSCSITNTGLGYLQPLTRLETLDLSFCNRITDVGLKALRALPRLSTLNLRGCVKVTRAGMARLGRKGLEIKA
jgi:hypothetical protein